MNEYELLGGLHCLIDENTEKRIFEWIMKHNTNYSLLYPLAAVEIGAMNCKPEATDNLFKRCMVGFIYSNALKSGKDIFLKKFNIPGLKRYLHEYETTLLPLFQNYRFSREINDINPVSKPRLTQVGEKKYQLTTSLVTDKYTEEDFYFYGEDDPLLSEMERKQIMNLHGKFWNRIVMQQTPISRLEKIVAEDLYEDCIQIVEKDLNKWESNVRSEVFDSSNQIAKVIAFFYYYALIKSISFRIGTLENEEYIDNADECIMLFDKEKCIQDISNTSKIKIDKTRRIVEYFINRGNSNLLEFPLFEIDNKLVTIPSLFLVNDWQFTIVNGHYAKQKNIIKRDKTISESTEKRINKLLQDVENIATVKTKPYSFTDESGDTQCSDIDYGIYDKERNVALIIEAKWINKHYKDEIDKRYGKIFETLNNIYSDQISKHQIFLERHENIDWLFQDDVRYVHNDNKPTIYYLAIDKRNQMHLGDKHMISEYMLLYFLRKHIISNKLDIITLWNEINRLQTKFEYITVSNEFYEIQIGDDIVLVEKSDLYWD